MSLMSTEAGAGTGTSQAANWVVVHGLSASVPRARILSWYVWPRTSATLGVIVAGDPVAEMVASVFVLSVSTKS